MRFVATLVLGGLMVIGAAYIRDASIDPGHDPSVKTLVNWEVASGMIRTAGGWTREQFDWIGRQLHRPE